jgi:hypothetical protein
MQSGPCRHGPDALLAALRWTEYAFQSFSNILLGLALALYRLAITVGAGYLRRLGWIAMGSGAAWVAHGGMVPYVGLFDSTPRLVAQVLLGLWAFIMAFLMWRNHGRQPVQHHLDEPAVAHAASH